MQVIDMSLATSSTKHLVRIVLFVYKTSYNLYFYLSLNLYSYIRPLSSIQNKFAFIVHEPLDLSMDSMQAGSSMRYQIYVDHLRYLCMVWRERYRSHSCRNNNMQYVKIFLSYQVFWLIYYSQAHATVSLFINRLYIFIINEQTYPMAFNSEILSDSRTIINYNYELLVTEVNSPLICQHFTL